VDQPRFRRRFADLRRRAFRDVSLYPFRLTACGTPRRKEGRLYLPPAFTEPDPEVLIAHIERWSFGLLVSHGPSGIIASHIPFLLERKAQQLFVQGHLARPNPQVAGLAAGGEALAVFSGPDAYISPSWYATGPAVPTWNYVSVHAYGEVSVKEGEAWLLPFLRRLSERHEGGSLCPWRLDALPEDYLAHMLKGIVGFEIAVSRLEGKWKLSQNRPAEDHPRIIAALEEQGDAAAMAIAQMMRKREPL
jgi:transcriptional regulator